MLRRKPTKTRVQESVRSAYHSELEQQQPVLMEAIQDSLRVVDWLAREGEPENAEAADEAREFLHADLYDRIVAAAAEADVETISDAVDRRIGRLLASFHREVLYQPAIDRALGKHRVSSTEEVWADEGEQDRLQGELFCSLREFATAGAWGYVIEAVAQDFGESSPFVEQLQAVEDEAGLPSLLERPES